ncbi:MAG TPA: cytochrome c oxidase assembly protein [Stellaceae bacterium]|nr:cytochrome c oxidase assembly protein [Stellaceae bacterium]
MKRENLRVLLPLGLLLGVMVGLISYSATLYRLFCAATGYGGATQRVAADTASPSSRIITVRFSTNVAPGLPWRFEPAQPEVRLHLGEETLAFFTAENLSARDYVAHAAFNVTPAKAGIYFKKIQCFCFTEERLGAHQQVEMPVDFFVDPQLGIDPSTKDVDTITLSYTFFASEHPEGAENLARFAETAPDPVAGRKLFASRCAGCHRLDRALIGPPLAGVIGRRAASLVGYPFSQALLASGIVWSPAILDRWLAGPQRLVPGALMPMGIEDAETRRDIIAYLEAQPGEKPAAARLKATRGE